MVIPEGTCHCLCPQHGLCEELEDVKAGRTQPAGEVFAELGKKYGISR